MDSEGGLNKVILGQQCQFNLKDNSRRFSCFPDLRNYFFHPSICLGINCLNLRFYIAALKSLRESMCQLRCVYEDLWYYPAEIRQRLSCRNIPHLHRHPIAWHVYYCTSAFLRNGFDSVGYSRVWRDIHISALVLCSLSKRWPPRRHIPCFYSSSMYVVLFVDLSNRSVREKSMHTKACNN